MYKVAAIGSNNGNYSLATRLCSSRVGVSMVGGNCKTYVFPSNINLFVRYAFVIIYPFWVHPKSTLVLNLQLLLINKFAY